MAQSPFVAHALANLLAVARTFCGPSCRDERRPLPRIRDTDVRKARNPASMQARAVSFRLPCRETRRVAFDVSRLEPAEQLVHRHAERLALDVPQCHVERAQGVHLLPARRDRNSPGTSIATVFDARGILADQHVGALLDGVLRAAFADSGNALIGLHRDY